MFSKLATLFLLAGAVINQGSALSNPEHERRKEDRVSVVGFHLPTCKAVKGVSPCAADVILPDGTHGTIDGPCVACPDGQSIEFEGGEKWYDCSAEIFADLDCLAPEPVLVTKDGCSDLPFNSYRVTCQK